jgi:hypothetical protein
VEEGEDIDVDRDAWGETVELRELRCALEHSIRNRNLLNTASSRRRGSVMKCGTRHADDRRLRPRRKGPRFHCTRVSDRARVMDQLRSGSWELSGVSALFFH